MEAVQFEWVNLADFLARNPEYEARPTPDGGICLVRKAEVENGKSKI